MDKIKIARDGDAVRSLGAWIGNNTDDATPWEAVLDAIYRDLRSWGKVWPMMMGRKIIIQVVVGGRTQYLTSAQGMPPHIEKAVIKMIREFMWKDDSAPRIALDILQHPLDQGSLNLLDITARNEAIDITWLKKYLDFSPSRPTWAVVTDMIINVTAPPSMNPIARLNSFLQSWSPPLKGQCTSHLNNDMIRMLKVGKKYKANLAAICLSTNLKNQFPAWYHLTLAPQLIRNTPSKCLLNKHEASRVVDLINISARLRNLDPAATHTRNTLCICEDCSIDRLNGCWDPNECALEAQKWINAIAPKLNPLLNAPQGNLSLMKRCSERNKAARLTQGEYIFDPTMTCKDDLAECFCIFTDKNQLSSILAECLQPNGTFQRREIIEVYTDGACLNNGKENAQSGSELWVGPDHVWNKAIRVPGTHQSNQIGEIAAIILTTSTIPSSVADS